MQKNLNPDIEYPRSKRMEYLKVLLESNINITKQYTAIDKIL